MPSSPPVLPPSTSVAQVLNLLDDRMKQVDRVIAQRLHSEVALVQQVAQYIITSGGKRIRPRLVLLVAHALGYAEDDQHLLAATVEFIHTATLLHDDVVDESTLRRGRATANAQFGNAASVLVGDFLYSRAFQMMVDVGRMRVLDILAEATNVIAEGEVLQLMNMHDPDVPIERYLEVIRCKTAKLFEASAQLGAILALHSKNENQPAEQNHALEIGCAAYGASLGTAFQLIDDLLDYESDSDTLGKNIGDDLREGKTTLPMLIAMQRCSPEELAILRSAIEHGEVDRLPEILALVRNTGALEETRNHAQAEANRAIQALSPLPDSAAKETLIWLAQNSVARLY